MSTRAPAHLSASFLLVTLLPTPFPNLLYASLVQSRPTGVEDGSDREIYMLTLATGETRRLTNNDVADAHPDWNAFKTGCR